MGYFAAILSALFHTSKDLMSKQLASAVDGTTSAFASFVYALPFYFVCLGFLSLYGDSWWEYRGDFVLFIVLRALVDTVAETLKMYAFMYADVSILAAVFALSPLLLLILSPFVTGDALKFHHGIAILCIVAGSLVLSWRSGMQNLRTQKKGIVIALVAAVFFALNTCLDRLAAQHSSAVFSGFSMTLLSALCILPFMFRLKRFKTLKGNSSGFLWRGFFEAGFMVSRLWALQFYSAPFVMTVQKLSIVLSIVGGKVAFKEQDFLRRLVAGGLVMLGILFALWQE
jgi:drug/metabolite transporter (DMT)-like permease